MKKYWLSIVIVLSTILLVVGATFAYFSFSIRANNNITADASNMSIIFTPGDELTEVVDPSSSRDNRIKTTASIRAVNGAVKPNANLYLNIEDISSSLTSGALVWEVEAVKNNQSVTLSPSSGTFENCMHNGVSGACVAGDKLYIVTDYELDYVDTEFTIYIWLDSSNISESVSDAVFNASIGADTEEFTGIVKIPNEYQKVEYIQSSGTQYINTGVIGKSGIELYADLSFVSVPPDGSPIFGSYGNNQRCYLLTYRSGGIFGSAIGNTPVVSNYNIVLNTRYQVYSYLATGSQILKINGVTEGANNDTTVLNTNKNIFLFGYNYNGNFDNQYPVSIKLYSLKLYDNGLFVREFVPVYRKSDSVVGLYDIQNGVFYSNANNSGDDFTAGPNVS